MNVKRTIKPAIEPVDLELAKSHLNVYHSDDDILIWSYISAARDAAENYTQRSFYTQTFVQTGRNWPKCEALKLMRSPVQSVISIQYYDSDNSLQTLASTEYYFDNGGEIATVEPVNLWPSLYDRPSAIQITFVSGEASEINIPSGIKQAILLLTGHFYEIRQPVIVGSQVREVPDSFKSLLDPYIVYHATV